jgi:hypothetical protein
MPQLDSLSYFSQFVYLLISFLFCYYFVVTFIIPSTLTADKLRAKFRVLSQLSLGEGKQSINPYEGNQRPSQLLKNKTLKGESLAASSVNICNRASNLDSIAADALTRLVSKSVALTTVGDFNALNKTGKHNLKSALRFNYIAVLAKKKKSALETLV